VLSQDVTSAHLRTLHIAGCEGLHAPTLREFVAVKPFSRAAARLVPLHLLLLLLLLLPLSGCHQCAPAHTAHSWPRGALSYLVAAFFAAASPQVVTSAHLRTLHIARR
jgi:hypothetical protein